MSEAAQQRTNPVVPNSRTNDLNGLTQPARSQEPLNTETVAVGNLGKAALELQRELQKCEALSHLPPEAREFLTEAKKHLTTLQAYQAQLEKSGAETRIVNEFTEYNARAQVNGVQQPLSGEAIQYLSLYRVAGALLRGMVSAAKVGEYQTQLDNTPLGQRATEAVVGKSGVSLSLEAVRDLHLKHIREEVTTHVRELTKLATAVASTATSSVTVQQQGEYIQSSIKFSRDTAWRFGETNLANIQGKVNAQRANREANFIALPGAAATLGGAAFIPLGLLGFGGGAVGLALEGLGVGGGKFGHEAMGKVLQAANGYRTGGLTEQQATAQAKQGLTEAATSGARAAALTVVTGAPFFLAPRAVTALTRAGVSAESARFVTGAALGGGAAAGRATLDGASQREVVGATGIGTLAGAASSLSTPLGGVSGVGINLLIQAGGLFAFSYARDGKVTFSGLTQTAGYMLPGISAGISAAHAPIVPPGPSNPTNRFKEFVRSLVPEVQQPHLAYAGGVATGPGRAAKHSDELQSGVSLRTGEWPRPNKAGYPGQNGTGYSGGATPTTPSAWTVTNRVHESSITSKRYEESLKQNQLSKKIKTVIENFEKGILPGRWEAIPGSPGLLKAKIHASDKNGRVVFSYDEKSKKVTIFAIYVKDHHGGGKTDLGEQRLHDHFRTIARDH